MQNTDMNQIIKSVSIMRSQNCDQVFYQKNKWSSSIIYSTHNQDEHLLMLCSVFVLFFTSWCIDLLMLERLVYRSVTVLVPYICHTLAH